MLNTESCKKIESIAERKKILMEEKLCFNCAGKKHQAQDCRNKGTCSTCNERHLPSICNKPYPNVLKMSSTDQGNVTHPVVVL